MKTVIGLLIILLLCFAAEAKDKDKGKSKDFDTMPPVGYVGIGFCSIMAGTH